jgi:hypothetical protein
MNANMEYTEIQDTRAGNAAPTMETKMRSEQIGNLAAALALAQAKLKNPAFDSTNPAFKSGFASLAAVRNSIVPVYAEFGLSLLQDLTTNEQGVSCTTTILHKSGEYMTFGPFTMPVGKKDPWGIAGGATYAKRISAQGVAFVVGDEDDDGAAAQASHGQKPFGDRSGRPDTTGVDPELKEQYSQGFANALLAFDDAKIISLREELKTQPELFTAVWDALNSKQRTEIRKIVEPKKVA